MIRRLWLRNWKAYESLDLTFDHGTTFLVAENGIGKTSIIQALYFALFGGQSLLGSSAPVTDAVRGANETVAIVGCHLTLDSKEVELERAIHGATLRSKLSTSVRIDGRSATEPEFVQLLRNATEVDPAQLALLAFVPEGSTITHSDAGISTVSTLSTIFGVDRLIELATRLAQKSRKLDRETDELRKSLRDIPQRHDIQRRPALINHLEAVEERIKALSNALASTERRDNLFRSWDVISTTGVISPASWSELSARIVESVSTACPDLRLPENFPADPASVEFVASRLAEHRDALLQERGRLLAAHEAAESAMVRLQTADPVCPLCYQPLSHEALTRALREHEEAAQRATINLGQVDRDAASIQRISEALGQLLNSRDVTEEMRRTDAIRIKSERAHLGDSNLAREELSRQAEIRSQLRAELMAIDRVVEDHGRNSALSARLHDNYRAAELSNLAADTMLKLAERIRADRIAPLADEVEKRWPRLWEDSVLKVADDGALALDVDGYSVPFSGLSGGQRTLAQIIVRVLALQMATRSPFLILDEPLEHLDPRNRRALATMLVSVTNQASTLRQVLVTTYEESVTRRISSWPIREDDRDGIDGLSSGRVLRILAAGT